MAPRRGASTAPAKRGASATPKRVASPSPAPNKNITALTKRNTTTPTSSLPSTPTSGGAQKKKKAPSSSSSTPAASSLSSAHHHQHHEGYEFLGPYIGPLGMFVGLPALTFAFTTLCGGGEKGEGGWPNVTLEQVQNVDFLVEKLKGSWDLKIFGIYVAYFTLQALFYLLAPATEAQGTVLPDGKLKTPTKLSYPINGLASLILTVVAVGIIDYTQVFGSEYGWTWIFDNLSQLAMSTIVFSWLLSIFLYWYSFQSNNTKLVAAGARNIPIYDFFLGRELNPRVFNINGRELDLKFFCELRPGLTMWLLINISCAGKQMQVYGKAYPDPWMFLVLLFEGYYVLDSVLNESLILTTMDITTDGFGFMLAFGDLAWVPAVYSLQARFLVGSGYTSFAEWSLVQYAAYAGVIALGLLGMYIFRSANSQKDLFKQNRNHPSLAGLATIPTNRGYPLLAGGWWGTARHINYFGDWIMSVSWSLATGFATPLTYFYPFYFAILLIHRDSRDFEKCELKYGDSWKKYCEKVKYRIVPYVY